MEYQLNAISSLDLIGQERVMNTERISAMFLAFIAEYKTTHKTYFHALSANITQNIMHMVVSLDHISRFSQTLASAIESSPLVALEAFEAAICKKYGLPHFQIQVITSGNCMPIRNVNATASNKIIKVRGIVVSSSTVFTRPKELFLTCRNCLSTRTTRDVIPRACEKSECPVDPYIIVPEKSIVADMQYGKLQEDFSDIPVGETPRHMSIVMEGDLVDRIIPGSQLRLTGVFVMSNTGRHSTGLLRILGIEGLDSKLKKSFTEEEEMFFRAISKNGIYEKIARSMAPSIYGSEDVKKALACMLFGGTRRLREDGIRLRGDINVLLLGDPGIAKSQLLKFVEMVAPVGVYTSGKGSSAAGLTASVMKDRNNTWVLEGGALVLADNGVCCIDEFDKMRDSDRVAIHEAMEQQTISIAKAGITTILNTRTAILAAANPVFGRYDDYKTPSENIEFGTTILSRFDLIFIIKDAHSTRDAKVAEHVVGLHLASNPASGLDNIEPRPADAHPDENAPILTVPQLQSYIQYAKRINPTLSAEAAARLSKFYVGIRQEVAGMKSPTHKNPIPITVRQLESLVRIGESLARMELLSVVNCAHVDEAIRLFQLSTMSAVSQGHMIEGMVRPSFYDELNTVMSKLKECMPVGSSRRFVDVVRSVGAKEAIVKSAVDYMIKQNKMLAKDYGRIIVRLP